MIVCTSCGWRGSGEHDCVGNLREQLAHYEDRFIALRDVIFDVHEQHGDDLCFMSIDRIFAAVGLPVPDRKVGDKAAMLANCRRYIDVMCQGGQWKSYAELEEENIRLQGRLDMLRLGEFRRQWLADTEPEYQQWLATPMTERPARSWVVRCRELLRAMRKNAGEIENAH